MKLQPSHLLVALVITGGAVGLFVGTRGTRITAEERRQTLIERAHAKPSGRIDLVDGVAAAVKWSELPLARRGPNANFKSHLSQLVGPPPAPEVAAGREQRLTTTLTARAERRAYDGAPPRIPHAIDERSTSACLACHADGVVIADRIAPRMSHPVFQNCTQCHVSLEKPQLESAGSPRDNAFAGSLPEPGVRFLPGSPPVMPHPLWMRQTCASCHGALGPPGLRTTHPERQSCEQCHAPAPSFTQEIFYP